MPARRQKLLVAMIAVIAMLLAACAGTEEADSDSVADTGEATDAGAEDEAPEAGGDDVAGQSVCYISAANSHPYVTPANEGVESEAETAGIDLTLVSAEFSPQTGADQLNSCVSRGVDGILLWPLDDNTYLPGLIQAEEAGIPVVAIDTPMGEESMALVQSFVGADKRDQGRISAQQMDEALGGSGSVIIIAGQAGNGTTIARTDGFQEELEAIGSEIEVLATVNADFDQQMALVASRDLITRYGDEIDGVYANDDTMARGFLQALDESDSSITPIVIGINGEQSAFEEIQAGRQHSTIIQPPFENGRLAMETLVAAMRGEDVDDNVPLVNTVVDADNVDDLEPAF